MQSSYSIWFLSAESAARAAKPYQKSPKHFVCLSPIRFLYKDSLETRGPCIYNFNNDNMLPKLNIPLPYTPHTPCT